MIFMETKLRPVYLIASAVLAITGLASPLLASERSESEKESSSDLVDVSVAAGNLNIFVEVLEASNLTETFKSGGPFTVFAPSDAAFESLPAGTLEALLEDPSSLASILNYHVIPGQYLATQTTYGDFILETVHGDTIEIVVTMTGEIRVDDASVISTDHIASNGVIHIVDAVLMPGE